LNLVLVGDVSVEGRLPPNFLEGLSRLLFPNRGLPWWLTDGSDEVFTLAGSPHEIIDVVEHFEVFV